MYKYHDASYICSHLSIVEHPPNHLWGRGGSVWAGEGATAVPWKMKMRDKSQVSGNWRSKLRTDKRQIQQRPVYSGLRPCARYARLRPSVASTWGGSMHASYLSPIGKVKKQISHVEKFQISIDDRCSSGLSKGTEQRKIEPKIVSRLRENIVRGTTTQGIDSF